MFRDNAVMLRYIHSELHWQARSCLFDNDDHLQYFCRLLENPSRLRAWAKLWGETAFIVQP